MSEKKEAQQMTVELIGNERECLEYIEYTKQINAKNEIEDKKERKLIKVLLILTVILLFITATLGIVSILHSEFLLKYLSIGQTSILQTFLIVISPLFLLLFIYALLTQMNSEKDHIQKDTGCNFEELCNASQSKRIRSVTFNPSDIPERTDISFCIQQQDSKFVTYQIFKNIQTLATSDENNKSKVCIEFVPGEENLKIYRYCDEMIPVGEVLKVV